MHRSGRIDARLQMAVWLVEKINLCQIDQLVTAAAEDSFEHEDAEARGLFQRVR
jgi:hypothetical protein